MTDRVGDRLAERERGIRRLVDSLHAARLESAGDRHVIQKKALRALEQIEGMAVEPPIVEELAFLGPSEAGYAKQTLRKVGQEPIRPAEQHDRGAQQRVLLHQPQPAQDGQRIPRIRVLYTPGMNAGLQGATDLLVVEVRYRPPGCRLEFPSRIGMQAFQENSVAFVARKNLIRRAHATKCLAAERIGLAVAGVDENHQHLAPAAQGHPLDRRKHRRLDLTQLLHDLFERAVAHLLADHSAIGLDAKEHPAAAMVEHRAKGARRLAPLTRGALELQSLRLAGCSPSGDGFNREATQSHVRTSPGFNPSRSRNSGGMSLQCSMSKSTSCRPLINPMRGKPASSATSAATPW